MTERAREWPLAVFTVALQCAAGFAMAATATDWHAVATAQVRLVGLAVFPLAAGGLVASLLHVGRPLRAWSALRNSTRSRLSREVLSSGMFTAAALVYSAMWFAGGRNVRVMMGAATVALGVLAVALTARVYLVSARPLWKRAWLPVSFAGTTLLLGGSAGMIAAPAVPALLPWYGGMTVAGALLSLVSAVEMARQWSRLRRAAQADPQLESWPPPRAGLWLWPAFALYLLWAATAPGIGWLAARACVVSMTLGVAAFGCLLLGALVGRMLMYALPASLVRF